MQHAGGFPMSSITATQRAVHAVWGMFAADSLALTAHWMYDTAAIAKEVGRPETLAAPVISRFHPNRKAGEFTHYGDQALVLLRSVAAEKGLSILDFFERWKALFADYDGYVDGATRNTLARIDFGEGPDTSGSNSTDLAGASRLPVLLPLFPDDEEGLVQAARLQTKVTHNSAQVLDAAEFFARAAFCALGGASVAEAVDHAAGFDYISAPIAAWTDEARQYASQDVVAAVARFGQSCNVEGAFRATVQMLLRHADDPREALIANVMAGGDSAARGMLAGAILGACGAPDAIPADWRDGLAHGPEIARHLDAITT